jgi:hypothetical protein
MTTLRRLLKGEGMCSRQQGLLVRQNNRCCLFTDRHTFERPPQLTLPLIRDQRRASHDIPNHYPYLNLICLRRTTNMHNLPRRRRHCRHFRPNKGGYIRITWRLLRLVYPTFASSSVLPFSSVYISSVGKLRFMNMKGLTIMRERSSPCCFIR